MKLGEIMTITGRMTFTSEKSMEIKVVADVENLLEGLWYKTSARVEKCKTPMYTATIQKGLP